jgi:hypothetical protein
MIVVEDHVWNGKWDGMPVIDAYLWNGHKFAPVKQLKTFPRPRFQLDSSGIVTGDDGIDRAVKLKWNGARLDTLEDIEYLDPFNPHGGMKVHDHRTGKTKTWSWKHQLSSEYGNGNYTLFVQGSH